MAKAWVVYVKFSLAESNIARQSATVLIPSDPQAFNLVVKSSGLDCTLFCNASRPITCASPTAVKAIATMAAVKMFFAQLIYTLDYLLNWILIRRVQCCECCQRKLGIVLCRISAVKKR